jgi:hypothetical protein
VIADIRLRLERSGKVPLWKDGAFVSWLRLTPDLAEGVLEFLNTENIRPLDHLRVGDYAAELTSGGWEAENFNPMVLGDDWSLFNAQHRCAAVARARKPMDVLVVVGSTDNARRACDYAKTRTITQTHGVKSTHAAIVRLLVAIPHGSDRAMRLTRSRLQREARGSQYTIEHYVSILGRRPMFREAQVAAAFVFAEVSKPEHADKIRELAEYLAIGDQKTEAAHLLAGWIAERKRAGLTLGGAGKRLLESRRILRVLQAHVLGAYLGKFPEAHEGVVAWWLEGAPVEVG